MIMCAQRMFRIGATGILFPVFAAVLSASDDPGVRASLYSPDGYDPGTFERILSGAGYEVDLMDEKGANDLAAADSDVLVIPPGTRYPALARPVLDAYRRAGGNVVILEPRALDYSVKSGNPRVVLDFDGRGEYRLREPRSSDVNPEPVVTTSAVDVPATDTPGLHVETRLIGDGHVFLEIPLAGQRGSGHSVVAFHALGDYDVNILYLALRDTRGRNWATFVELDRDWGYFEVPMADFLPVDKDLEGGIDTVEPGEVERLTVGMNRWVLWPEVGGSFALGAVALLEPETPVAGPRGAVAPWHLQHGRADADHPDWLEDPFLGSRVIPGVERVETTSRGAGLHPLSEAPRGAVSSIASPPHERGRERTELIEVLRRDDHLRRPLLVARDSRGRELDTVAEVRDFTGGRYAGSSLALFGLPEEAYGEDSGAARLLLETLQYVTRTPRIVRVAALSPEFQAEDASLRCRIRVRNPGPTAFEGRLRLAAAGGILAGNRAIRIGSSDTMEITVTLGEVPADFPWEAFGWEVVLEDSGGNEVDRLEDRVDVELTLAKIARYCLSVQDEHRDGRYSHHFFSDIYGARFLLAYARHLRKNGGPERVRSELGGLTWRDLADSALRFGDMIADRQREDGAFPMGYGEHRDIIFVADLGSICLGLVQMATWLDDPRRERYIDVARRYFEFRQSFYLDEDQAAELEAEYGEDPDRIRPGFYGIGLLGSDYFDGGRWDDIRPERRGRWWVLPVSLSFLGALIQVDDSPEFREVAERDTRFFVEGDFPIRDVSYFHVETLFWMYYAFDDPGLRAAIAEKLEEFPPTVLTGKEYDEIDYQGRGILRWLSLQYYRRYLKDSDRIRAGLLKGLWTTGSETSAYSLSAVSAKYPRTVYGPSIGAFRYHAYAGIWLMELFEEGSSLLRNRPFPDD